MTEPALPALVIHPQALSAEHHLLRVLSHGAPATRAEALRRVQQRFPDYTGLGTPEKPTRHAEDAWRALKAAGWAAYRQHGQQHGYVLTGLGEARLQTLHRNQVLLPWIRLVEQTCGPDVARAALARETR